MPAPRCSPCMSWRKRFHIHLFSSFNILALDQFSFALSLAVPTLPLCTLLSPCWLSRSEWLVEIDGNLTVAGRLLLLIESAPHCQCGGNCELLQSLAAQLLDIQSQEIGYEAQCPYCSEQLFFDQTSPLQLYNCRKCNKWFQLDPGTSPVEIKTKPSRELLTDYR